MAGYDFQLVVRDIYSTSTALDDMPTKEVFLDVNETTGSMGFGGESVNEGATPRYDFYGPVYFRAGTTGQLVYSTAESDTGLRWIDGRPIYCKTFRGSQLTNGGGTVIGTIEGVEEVVRFDGYIQRADSDTIMPLNYSYYNNAQQMCSVNLSNVGAVRVQKGTAWMCKIYVVSVFYTKTADAPTYYYLPFLTTPNEQNCTLTASSEYSSVYQVEYAFNGLTSNYWACAVSDAQRWVQVQLPYALRNMVVKLVSPQGSAVTAANAPVSGAFQGSNDGSSWAALGSYSGRSTAAGSVTTHSLNNSTGYKYLRISITSPGASSGVWTGFGDIRVEGEVA